MKKYILLIISFVFISSISAQSFGFKAGALTSSFSGADSDGVAARAGLYIGAFTKFGEGTIEWMPELLYQKKGARNVSLENDQVILNYIDLSINGIFHFTDEFALSIGPYVGYAISGTVKPENTATVSINEWNKYNRVDFGSNLGGIYAINDLLHVNLRVSIGFIDVLKDYNLHNSALQIGVGYVFGY